MQPILISIADTAIALSVGRTSVYKLIETGELETLKMGRRRLVTVSSIKRLAEKQD